MPPLGARLGALPEPAGAWCIHDLALLPEARGSGAGARAVARSLRAARRRGLCEATLVAVGGAAGFWRHQGFGALERPPPAGYGRDAVLMVRRLAGLTPPPS
ncbi:hypothetical protein OPKNFCMD_4465 [Methylobacterium crusticola]|uniref:N-acetyltransferase domain-containing protein n=1 Tax=Methylobacterium crusticola TaxID=1697972 RepID=A0ABQ4R3G3_9HYPH|nr:GNAT family N-acetyltransferase [Methylobacterium crusticola]GJD51710.1 hypothetical protein OPKNFCMD_4465 [Methylobacterium crusticola]